MGSSAILDGKSIIFFDSHCLLCNQLVSWLLKHDKANLFYYSSLSGNTAKTPRFPTNIIKPDSMIFFNESKCFFQSTAILEIIRLLGYPYRLLYGFVIIPRVVRDYFYNQLAKRRKRWFGQSETCLIGDEEHLKRILE